MPQAFPRFAARCAAALVLCAPVARAQGNGGKIEGVIADSLRGGPLVGALVVATASSGPRDTVFHATQTDARGRFVLANLRAGAYAVTVEHPVIDSTGIGAPPVAVKVDEAGTTNAFLAIPSGARLRRVLCANVRDTLLGVITGSVRHAGGRAASNALVVFWWTDFEVDSANARVLSYQVDSSARTDGNGVYRACGLPIQRTLFVQAQGDLDVQSGILEERINSAGVLVRDFQIGSVAREASAAGGQPSGFVLFGKVTALDNRPIASAQVMLMGGTRGATTNERGEFRIADISPGTQGVRVVALGFYPQMLRVEPVSGETSVTIRMENAAVVLDSMRVIAKRTNTRLRYTGREFEKRATHSPGIFITEEQIASFGAIVTTDVFRHVPGVRLATPRGSGSEMLTSTRGPADFGATICPMDVFLDGMRIGFDDIRMVSPDMLHGVEVHSVATAPVGYKIGKCGAVFIWTK
ncbi:hypothetical protein BH09GEM1_BH09GEM1_01430 [soil metagenome]